jgi:hypothetical protein
LALRELHASHIGEKARAIGEIPDCQCAGNGRTLITGGTIRAAKPFQHGEMKMKCLMTFALAAALGTPTASVAQSATSIAINCDAEAASADDEILNLHGNWDFLMNVGGTPNFGLLSIGFVDDAYGGSLALWMTAPVVLRKVTLTGVSFRMDVASREGDVLFSGRLSAKGDRMCGTITYHGGRTFPAVAQKRPSTYQSQPQAQRVR